MADDLRAYEVTCAAYPDHPQTVRAATGGRARMEVARSIAETCDAPMGTILRSLRVRALSPRRLPRREPTTLDRLSHEMLRHALGYGEPRAEPGWRNWYCAGTEPSAELAVWERMVASGLAERGGTINEGRERYYRATDAGKAEAEKPVGGGAPALPGAEGEGEGETP